MKTGRIIIIGIVKYRIKHRDDEDGDRDCREYKK